MVGMIGTLRQQSVLVHHVPLLRCPVCGEIEIHHEMREEFELLVTYAVEDGEKEIALRKMITLDMLAHWKEYSVSFQEDEDMEPVLREQIDYSIDLLRVARILGDDSWLEEIKHRLHVLGDNLKKCEQQKEGSR